MNRYRFEAIIWRSRSETDPVTEVGIIYALDKPEAFTRAKRVVQAMAHAGRVVDIRQEESAESATEDGGRS
jgi:hypothetical protein